MLKSAYFAIACFVSYVAFISPADARCSERCREKCRANPGPQTVENCIRLWSCINSNYQNTRRFEDAPPPSKCKHLLKLKSKR